MRGGEDAYDVRKTPEVCPFPVRLSPRTSEHHRARDGRTPGVFLRVPSVKCPACPRRDGNVLETRAVGDGSRLRRRRSCACGNRWFTVEVEETTTGRAVGKTSLTAEIPTGSGKTLPVVILTEGKSLPVVSEGGGGVSVSSLLSLPFPVSSSPVPLSNPESDAGARGKKKATELSPRFMTFWLVYPRKAARAAAWKAWRAVGAEGRAAEIMAAIVAQTDADFRFREESKIPHAASWLNGERWTDEVKAGGRQTSDVRIGHTMAEVKPRASGEVKI